jgi:hypothetical protein
MVELTHSLTMELNGTIQTMTDMEIIQFLQLRAMLVLQRMEPVHRIGTVAQTEMVMATLTMVMHSRPMVPNGQILTLMVMVTITTMMFSQLQNGISTN